MTGSNSKDTNSKEDINKDNTNKESTSKDTTNKETKDTTSKETTSKTSDDSKDDADDLEELVEADDEDATSTRVSYQFQVARHVYQQDTLNKDADYLFQKRTFSHKYRKFRQQISIRDFLLRSVPIAYWLPRYRMKDYFMSDFIAGATNAIIHIPQGMAYAMLADVPPVVGLYMAFFPCLMYVIFGTSPHISIGTFAVICLMSGKTLNELIHHQLPHLNNTTPHTAGANVTVAPVVYKPVDLIGTLCFEVGCVQLAMWFCRLGTMSTLLSEPLVSGFICAASYQVLTSLLKELIGIETLPKFSGSFNVIKTVLAVFDHLDNINWAVFITSLITVVTISLHLFFLKPQFAKLTRVPVPMELIVLVIGTMICRYFTICEQCKIKPVGHIPTGLPTPSLPRFDLMHLITLDSFVISIVSYSITMSLALTSAAIEKTEVDANQELLAMGMCNIVGSLFSCGPICAGVSRSVIQHRVGSKTCLTTVISACIICFVLLWIGPFFEPLPHAVLSAFILVALTGMMLKVTDLVKFGRLSFLDAAVWTITFFTALIIDIDLGLLAGLISCVCCLFCRLLQPEYCILGRVPNTDLYLDVKRFRAAVEIPGIKIFHYSGGLNFASKTLFRDILYRKVGCMKPEVEPEAPATWDSEVNTRIQCVIIDGSAISHVDAFGVKGLISIQEDLKALNIKMYLVVASAPIMEMVQKFNLLQKEKFIVRTFPTIHDAVMYYELSKLRRLETELHVDSLMISTDK